MGRVSRLGAVAAFAVMMTVVFSLPMSAGDEKKDWTVLVYLDGDNNLEAYSDTSLEQLEMVGSDEHVNYVVLYDRLSTVADLYYVEQGESVPVGDEYGFPKEVNMADPTVFEEFIVNGIQDYPAEKYSVMIWDHGGGWRGICWDDTTYEETGVDDCITMVELRDVFEGVYEATGEVIGVVGFDACLMAMPEVGYQMRDYATYLVWSEETISAYSFPYDAMGFALAADPTMDAKEYATVVAKEYADFYGGMTGFVDWTISVFDTTYMDGLTAAVDFLGKELLASLSTYVNAYQSAYIQADQYYYPYNVDLIGFAQNLIGDATIQDEGIKEAAQEVILATDACVFAVFNGQHNVDSTGLAIYMPSCHDGMKSLKPEYIEVPFATETSWYDFCEAFSDFNGRTWVAEKVI
jgi:hypothetical protein